VVKTLFAKESNKASPCADKPKRPDSGHPLPVQSNLSVQTLDGLIPARVQQASRAGCFADTKENMKLHSLLHINVLWLVDRILRNQYKRAEISLATR